MWTVTAQYGNIDPDFDACRLAEAAGATFIARESVLDPKKIEKALVQGFQHEGFSFFDIFSNCHINLGRKNKMGEAVENLAWIKNRILPKRQFEELSLEEQAGRFPTGILKHDTTQLEYCKAYAQVIERAQKGAKS